MRIVIFNFRFAFMTQYLKFGYLILSLLLITFSCSDRDPAPVEQERKLIEATVVSKKTAGQLQLLAQLSGGQIDPSVLKYDVTVYKVTYSTTYKDSEIKASGLVIMPYSTTDRFPMLSVQHGTIVEHSAAPSVQSPESYEILLYSALASSGFITAVPDYLGFGESKNILHPYYVEKPMAESIADNVLAAANLADDKKIKFDERLFLAGYSEGGYATLAAHKYIEEHSLDHINLVASFPAAGGYDLTAMQKYFFGLTTYSQPFYMAYVLKSYQEYYGFQSAVSDVFNEPYASKIGSLFNGSTSSGDINFALTNTIPDLIRSDIRTNISTDSKYEYLINAFRENSLTDWTPTKQIYFYHGDADETVPYNNSQLTFQKLLDNGTPQNLITFITLTGSTHSTGAVPYFQDVISRLLKMK
jgi:pimeloyl-ACP methyl ester carboxylesterase